MSGVIARTTATSGAHPHLTLYLLGLVVTWGVSAATWTVTSQGRIELAPIALVLQYLAVVAAAILAGDRLLRSSRDREADESRVSFMTIRQDDSGRVWWTCMWAGIVAMEVNVALLIAAELLVGHVDLGAVIGAYVSWILISIVVGAIIGTFSAVIPLLISRLGARRAKRRASSSC